MQNVCSDPDHAVNILECMVIKTVSRRYIASRYHIGVPFLNCPFVSLFTGGCESLKAFNSYPQQLYRTTIKINQYNHILQILYLFYRISLSCFQNVEKKENKERKECDR